VRLWLRKAEQAARKLDDTAEPGGTSEKANALWSIALQCAQLGQVDCARAIAADLGGEARDEIIERIPFWIAEAGDIETAIQEARKIGKPATWAAVCRTCAYTDVPKALGLIPKVPKPRRSWVYIGILKQQLYAGDWKGAQETASRIEGEKYKGQARAWMAAYRLVEGDGDIKAAAAKAGIDLTKARIKLCDLMEANMERGRLRQAMRVLDVLALAEDRCLGYTLLARYHLKRGNKGDYERAIGRALKEASRIGPSPAAGFHYRQIARVQIRAGDLEAATASLARLRRLDRIDADPQAAAGELTASEEAAVKADLSGLLMGADKPELAIRVATTASGDIIPWAVHWVVEAYARLRESKKLAELTDRFKSDHERYYLLCLQAARGAYKSQRVE
jgi:hypothetical protein